MMLLFLSWVLTCNGTKWPKLCLCAVKKLLTHCKLPWGKGPANSAFSICRLPPCILSFLRGLRWYWLLKTFILFSLIFVRVQSTEDPHDQILWGVDPGTVTVSIPVRDVTWTESVLWCRLYFRVASGDSGALLRRRRVAADRRDIRSSSAVLWRTQVCLLVIGVNRPCLRYTTHTDSISSLFVSYLTAAYCDCLFILFTY